MWFLAAEKDLMAHNQSASLGMLLEMGGEFEGKNTKQ